MICYCTRVDNPCEKKDTCKRYLQEERNLEMKLCCCLCTESNNYVLYIKGENTDLVVPEENNEEGGVAASL